MAAHAASPSIPIVVIDASTTEATRDVCESIARRHQSSLNLIYRRARQPGLARQRNEAIGICRELGAEVVHFIDDDTEVSAGYFDALEKRFRRDPEVMGAGGIIVNQPTVNYLAIKSLFFVGSRRLGSVLRSGRPMLGQYPGTQATAGVEWLSGCSMSFRVAVFDEMMFDSRLQGYSLGEDYDFGFRVSRKHKLAVEPAATCVHHLTPTARGSMRALARQRTQTTHGWVSEQRELGISRTAFWWSAFGDFLLHVTYGVLRGNKVSLQEAQGVIDGVVAIARGGRARATMPDSASPSASRGESAERHNEEASDADLRDA